MNVDIQSDLTLHIDHRQHLLGLIYLRMQMGRGILPSPVKVHAQQAASVVAVDNAVDVQHGDDLENEATSRRRFPRKVHTRC